MPPPLVAAVPIVGGTLFVVVSLALVAVDVRLLRRDTGVAFPPRHISAAIESPKRAPFWWMLVAMPVFCASAWLTAIWQERILERLGLGEASLLTGAVLALPFGLLFALVPQRSDREWLEHIGVAIHIPTTVLWMSFSGMHAAQSADATAALVEAGYSSATLLAWRQALLVAFWIGAVVALAPLAFVVRAYDDMRAAWAREGAGPELDRRAVRLNRASIVLLTGQVIVGLALALSLVLCGVEFAMLAARG